MQSVHYLKPLRLRLSVLRDSVLSHLVVECGFISIVYMIKTGLLYTKYQSQLP